MKKQMLSFALAALCSSPLFAQEMTANAGRTTFGIRAGVNFQNINGKDADDDKLKNDLLTAFHAGINVEIPVGTGTYIQPGALYSVKGAKWENKSETKISYVEIPVNLIYKPVVGTGNMVLGFGPYVGFGISGKQKDSDGDEMDIKFTNEYEVSLTNPQPQYRRMDAGANFLAGYEFANRLSFQLNAQLGLTDINPKIPENLGGDNINFRNTGWGISLGYRF
ncbi:porin family protein [Paraflavisolibacter sp. H34]|uniref:porin family protein n=1 Tax=Huijunlia imazamoxiresistens TaxID=3127457 RepID=UPI00301B3129